MKTLLSVIIFALALVAIAPAQTDFQNLGAFGVSYKPGDSTPIAGTGLYARKISAAAGTWAFTSVDALPLSVQPFTVSTQFTAGVAQRVVTINTVEIFVPTSAGISYTGTNTGWAWSTGALASVPIGNSRWKLMPNVRLVKSSVSAGDGYQVIGGVMIGVGW